MISRRVLGVLVLLFSAFHWLPLAPIMRFAAITANPWEAFEGILAVILLIGGVALLCDVSWGRGFVRFGSASLILVNLANLVVSRVGGSAYILTRYELFENLPLLLIFLASFVARSSVASGERFSHEQARERNLRDLAYGSYLWVGVSMSIFCIAKLLSSDPHWKDIAVLAIALPILWPAPVVAVVGVISSIIAFRDWRLVVLAMLTISSMLLSFGAVYELVSDVHFFTFISLVSVLIFLFSVRWFAIDRRHRG